MPPAKTPKSQRRHGGRVCRSKDAASGLWETSNEPASNWERQRSSSAWAAVAKDRAATPAAIIRPRIILGAPLADFLSAPSIARRAAFHQRHRFVLWSWP